MICLETIVILASSALLALFLSEKWSYAYSKETEAPVICSAFLIFKELGQTESQLTRIWNTT